MALAKAGFVVAAAEYRTVPDYFPALLNDAKSAVHYLRAHAKQFNIGPNRIGVIGDSAGGYVSQMMGTTNSETEFDVGDFTEVSSDVQAAVTIYGISSLLNISDGYSDAIQKVHASPSVTETLALYNILYKWKIFYSAELDENPNFISSSGFSSVTYIFSICTPSSFPSV